VKPPQSDGSVAFAIGATLWQVKGKFFMASGVRTRPWPVPYDLAREPVKDFTQFQIAQMWNYAMVKLWMDKHYGVGHLIADAALVPLKRFFSQFFPTDETPGLGVCSSFQAHLDLAAFVYPFGDIDPAMITPGNYAEVAVYHDL